MGSTPSRIPPGQTPARRRTWLRRSAKLLLSTLLFLVLCEAGLRATLFTSNARVARSAARLRKADNFAHRWSPEYWKLLRLFASGERKTANYEPLLGWMPRRIDAETYDHADHDPASGKRPVLVYGDSFAQCVTGPSDCWEGLLARSELGATHALMNYGAGGYGFDQAFLLLRESLHNYLDEDPVVIVSVLVDEDMDRAILPFRGWPKPRFEIGAGGELVWEGPVTEDPLEYLDEHPPRIASYLWRYVLHATEWVPEAPRARWIGKAETYQETRRLNRRILEELRTLLDARGVEYFVLLFHGKGFFRETPPDRWREAFLVRELDRLEIPWVSSRTVIQEDMRQSGKRMEDYFIQKGNGKGHYNPPGNAVVFEAIRRGLAHRYEGHTGPDSIDSPSSRSLPAPGAFARFGTKPLPPFEATEDVPRWVLGSGPGGPTELRYRLYGEVGSFSAILKPIPAAEGSSAAPLELSLWTDGERALSHASSARTPITLDLTGVHEFVIRAASVEGDAGALLLASPAFQP